MFVLLFVYVFGGAIQTPGYDYVDFLIPGIIVQTIAFGGALTAVGPHRRPQEGPDRPLPLAADGALGGARRPHAGRPRRQRVLDAIVLVVGVIVGFSFNSLGRRDRAHGFVLLLLFGYAFSWIFALIGLSVSSPEAAQQFGFTAIFPLTFISSAFVPVDSMPSALQTFAKVNPFTIMVDAMRALLLGAPAGNTIWQRALWIARADRRVRAARGPAAIAACPRPRR